MEVDRLVAELEVDKSLTSPEAQISATIEDALIAEFFGKTHEEYEGRLSATLRLFKGLTLGVPSITYVVWGAAPCRHAQPLQYRISGRNCGNSRGFVRRSDISSRDG
eukprot:1179465-Prorocentrum_minimum.AAC.27